MAFWHCSIKALQMLMLEKVAFQLMLLVLALTKHLITDLSLILLIYLQRQKSLKHFNLAATLLVA